MTKWDTIQADVSDMYEHLDEEETLVEWLGEDEDFFGFAKSIELDHLTDEQLDEVFNMFGDK
jgi:hypothetical protein